MPHVEQEGGVFLTVDGDTAIGLKVREAYHAEVAFVGEDGAYRTKRVTVFFTGEVLIAACRLDKFEPFRYLCLYVDAFGLAISEEDAVY